MKSGWNLSVLALMSLVLVTFSGSSAAALIRGEFTAVVVGLDNISGDPQSSLDFLAGFGVTDGALVTGSYTVDTSTPDRLPDDPSNGEFPNALVEVNFRVGDVVAEIPAPVFGSTTVYVKDYPPSALPHLNDLWGIFASIVPSTPGFDDALFGFTLSNPGGTALQGAGLDQILPPLSEFDSSFTEFGAFYFFPGGSASVSAVVLSHSQAYVPLPASIWLMATAIGLLGAGKRYLARGRAR